MGVIRIMQYISWPSRRPLALLGHIYFWTSKFPFLWCMIDECNLGCGLYGLSLLQMCTCLKTAVSICLFSLPGLQSFSFSVDWIINGSATCFTWVSIVSKFFIGEICYHDNQVQPVLPSLLLMSALSQLFLVAVAISIAVDSYRNYAKGITVFIFLLNLTVIMLGLIFVLKGWNSPQMEPANIIPVVAQPTPSNETDSPRNVSVEHLSYSVSITTFPTNKASTQHSVLEKRDFRSYKKSCRDLILVCATIAFPVDGLLTVSLILLFIFSIKIKGTQDISQGLHDYESPLMESIENKRILKEE